MGKNTSLGSTSLGEAMGKAAEQNSQSIIAQQIHSSKQKRERSNGPTATIARRSRTRTSSASTIIKKAKKPKS